MSTIKDVAKAAGVSIGTVSNVLNSPEIVTPEKRMRVQEAISRLSYQPNLVARTLKTRISKSIGLIIPDIKNPYYPAVARGVEDAAQRAGFTVFLCNNDRNVEKEREYIEALCKKEVDGLILVKPQVTPEELQRLSQQHSIVLVDADVHLAPEVQCNFVNVDDKGNVAKALEILYEQGHRRIALISGLLESSGSKITHDVYLEFLRKRKIPVNPSYIIRGNYEWTGGLAAARELLSLESPPTAIFAANDLMAIGAIRAAREAGLRVPEDISVFGYDDIDMAQFCDPPLSTIHLPKYELGTASVDLLVEEFRLAASGQEPASRRLLLDTRIILRESTGCVSNKVKM